MTTPADISLSGQGVAGHYYNITTRRNEPLYDYSGPEMVQLDSTIDFSSGAGWSPFGTSDSQTSNLYFSIRWTGKVLADVDGVYTFISNTDDAGYLYVDGVLVSSDPGGPSGHGEQDAANRTPITLTAGWHNFIFDYGQGWGGFGAHMKWITPGSTTPVIVPNDHLEARSDIPAAPTNMSSSGLTTGKVTIAWKDNSINETVYYLERSSTEAFTAGTVTRYLLAPNYTGTMSYTDKTLTKDTDYYYRVRAANYDGSSSYGPVVHVRTPSIDVLPDAPSDFTITAPGSHVGVSAGLFWKDNAYNEENYIVERKEGAAGTWAAIATLGENATAYFDTDPTLLPGVTYFYRVRAENGVGPSAYTAELSIQPAAPVVGTGVGLLGRYYNNEYFAGDPVATRIDRIVNFDFDVQHSQRPTGFNIENEGVVWVGRVQAQVSGYYTFATESDDGSYVYLDENPVPIVDNGGPHGRQRRTSAPIFLEAGSFHTIKATMFQGNGGANMTLEWSAPGVGTTDNPFVAIPTTQLYTPDFAAAMVAPTNPTVAAMHGKNVLRWNNSATNTKGVKVLRATTANGPFSLIATVQPDTNAYYDTAVEAGKTYFYKVANSNDGGDSAPTAAVSTTAVSANLPQGWQQSEVGIPLYSPQLPGDGFFDAEASTFTVIADGDDIWNQVDQFHFVYLPIPNVDGTITARLLAQDDTNAWAKSGLMFRDSLDQGARKVFLGMTPDSHGAVEFTGRVTPNYWSYHFPETGATIEGMYHPIDLRLVRQNNTFTAYAKGENDVDWMQVGEPGIIPLDGSTIYVGLAVTSHVRGVLGTATFQDVSIETADLTQAPAAASDLAVVEGAGTGLIQLTWTDNSANESGFKILRATSASGQYEQIGLTPANATSFVDRNLTAGKTYYYKVVATNALAPAAGQDSSATPAQSAKPGTLAPINYTDFADTPALQLNQDAAPFEQDGKTILRLMPSEASKIGTVFTVDQRDITAFSTTFDFQITNPQGGGADGFCFVIQNSDAGAGYIGGG
ncbi:MAG: PA14 domain-containing protein, partial [Actinomycetota bacterium]